jgi:hypothetical protein
MVVSFGSDDFVEEKSDSESCGNKDSNFFVLNPEIVPKLGNLRFGNSKTRKTG